MNNIGPLEAYQIFAEGERESNRLLTERTTIYLAASSLLFLAFVMLSQSSVTFTPVLAKSLRIILSVLGIFLTFLLYSFNRATNNALDFLKGAMSHIENGQEFNYMRERGILPHIDGWKFINGEKRWKKDYSTITHAKRCRKPFLFKDISCVYLPITFGILWITSFIVTILNPLCTK